MNTQTVLIIDDEADIRELLEITLLRMGLETAAHLACAATPNGHRTVSSSEQT